MNLVGEVAHFSGTQTLYTHKFCEVNVFFEQGLKDQGASSIMVMGTF